MLSSPAATGRFSDSEDIRVLTVNGSEYSSCAVFFLSSYLKLRQALFELLDTRVGDLGTRQNQPLQSAQALEVLQARVRDLRIGQSHHLQCGQALEVGQTRIRDLGAPQTQLL
jgi:hypothetical protein